MISPKCYIVDTSTRINELIELFNSSNKKYYGVAVIVNENNSVVGYINSADIMRILGNSVDLNSTVGQVSTMNFISVKDSLSKSEMLAEVNKQIEFRFKNQKKINYVVIVNDDDNFIDLVPYLELFSTKEVTSEVLVYGMGFVGLTLASVLSNYGYNVTGVDIDKKILLNLVNEDFHIHEPGLSKYIKIALDNKNLKFSHFDDVDKELNRSNMIHIIAVGSPITDSLVPDLSSITNVTNKIGANLKSGDLVILRSTVPVGTSRDYVIPLLEKTSNLKVGEDFSFSFCPERTVEGNAIEELKRLPQIVGGFSKKCVERSINFFNSFNSNSFAASSLEEAELIKLANNSFRDLSFAFSNGLSLLCDRYNLSANNLINLANLGYPRNPIPSPSPGVGGYCLTKDPFILASNDKDSLLSRLSVLGRKINNELSYYPIRMIERYLYSSKLKKENMIVFVVGLAFKGQPETNDYRGSASIQLLEELQNRGFACNVYDAVIKNHEIKSLGYQYVDLYEGINNADIVIFMNNHPNNYPENLFDKIQKSIMIFDGWDKLDKNQFVKNDFIHYSSIGFRDF